MSLNGSSEHIWTYVEFKNKKVMFDLGNQKVNVPFTCGRRHTATLKEVANRKKINCNCGITIQLSDSGGSVKKSVTNINKSVSDLEKVLKKIGR